MSSAFSLSDNTYNPCRMRGTFSDMHNRFPTTNLSLPCRYIDIQTCTSYLSWTTGIEETLPVALIDKPCRKSKCDTKSKVLFQFNMVRYHSTTNIRTNFLCL